MNRSSPKTPYEIRQELLTLAFDILNAKHRAAAVADLTGDGRPRTSPTTEEVIAEAEKLNVFVSKENQSR